MLVVVASLSAAVPALAATAFIATMRAPSGSAEAGGQLYRIDLQTRTSTLVGRILVDGAYPIGLTAMAFHPKTNVLYAVTVGIFDAQRATLLTIDPKTAEARLVRRLSLPLTDISFDPEGRLYGCATTGQLATVDLQTGKVATLGPATGSPGGAFAIDAQGNAYVAPWSGPATLDRVDLKAGTVVPGPRLTGLRDVATLRSMKFSGKGELLAAQSIRDAHAASALLRIDPSTGSVVAVADIPEDAEAIAILENEMLAWDTQRVVAYGLVVAALVVLAIFFFYMRLKRRKPG